MKKESEMCANVLRQETGEFDFDPAELSDDSQDEAPAEEIIEAHKGTV